MASPSKPRSEPANPRQAAAVSSNSLSFANVTRLGAGAGAPAPAMRTTHASGPVRIGDLASPSASSSSERDVETKWRQILQKEHEAKYQSQQASHEAHLTTIALQTSEQVALLDVQAKRIAAAELRVGELASEKLHTAEVENALLLRCAELESKQQAGNYPDNLSDNVPHSIAPSAAAANQPVTSKLLQTMISSDYFSASLTDSSNLFPYGHPLSSGMLRARLSKDAAHFHGQGQQYYFHVLSILPLPINKYLAAYALYDTGLKTDPLRLIEFLCYRLSYGFAKHLALIRLAVPKTAADVAHFMTVINKIDFDRLYSARIGRLYPSFFVRLGLFGIDAVSPDVDYTTLVTGSEFTPASCTVLMHRPLAWLRFKEDLAFADILELFSRSGSFTSAGAVHTLSTSSRRSHERAGGAARDADRTGTSRQRSDHELERDDGRADRGRSSRSDRDDGDGREDGSASSGRSERGGRGGTQRSSSRNPRSSFRSFTFGPNKERMCHGFFENDFCSKRQYPDHIRDFKHWRKGASPTLDAAYAAWKVERSNHDTNARDASPAPSEEDEIPADEV